VSSAHAAHDHDGVQLAGDYQQRMALWREWLALGASGASIAHRDGNQSTLRLFCGGICLDSGPVSDDFYQYLTELREGDHEA
jgi:hypothetical protein